MSATLIATPAALAVSFAAARIVEGNVDEACVKKAIIRKACRTYGVDLDAFIEAATKAAAEIRKQLV